MRIVTIDYSNKIRLKPLFLLFVLALIGCNSLPWVEGDKVFSGQQAIQDVEYQLKLGPRVMGSVAHQKTVEWIVSQLEKSRWEVEIQAGDVSGMTVNNIIAKRGNGIPWIIIGSHYDSRPYADQELTREARLQAVPGANDGASTVAILLEIARVLPKHLDKQIWLVFFDAEDIAGDQLAVGSQYFVDQLVGKPDSTVILDMLGDKDLNINMEKNSDPNLNKEIWGVAAELGYTQFIPTYKYPILDDHIPFLNAGIRSVDIIDFDYPYWHTTQDTLDKVSADSLKVVGDTIVKWLEIYPEN